MEQEQFAQLKERILGMIRIMGYPDSSVEFSSETKRLSVFINDPTGKPLNIRSEMRQALEHVLKQMARHAGLYPVYVDLNNYHIQREKLIRELARAAAHKVIITHAPVELPPMNSYERRIAHVELATRPDVETESHGEGRERHIVVKPYE